MANVVKNSKYTNILLSNTVDEELTKILEAEELSRSRAINIALISFIKNYEATENKAEFIRTLNKEYKDIL